MNNERKPSNLAWVLTILIAIAAGSLSALVAREMLVVPNDKNRDGKVDEWTYFDLTGRIQRYERDKSRDGKPDMYEFYKDGKIQLLRADFDYDGRFEVTGFYKDGKLTAIARDMNGDGVYDRISYHDDKSDVPSLMIADDNYDGVWDRRCFRGKTWEKLTKDAFSNVGGPKTLLDKNVSGEAKPGGE